jgi:signal transduction histidine kinase/ActR/RegA family two-component response regulator
MGRSQELGRFERAGSLRSGVATRLVAVLALGMVGMLSVVALLFVSASNRTIDQGMDSALAHYGAQVAQIELEWRVQAETVKVQLGFMRVLDEPDPVRRNARLAAYMACFGCRGTFTHMQVLDSSDRVLFRYFTQSQQHLPVPPAGANAARWVLGELDRTVYRVQVQDVALGSDPGRLILYAPIDNAMLLRLAMPDTDVSVQWGEQVLAQSPPRQPPAGGFLANLNTMTGTRVLRWSDEPGAPAMSITRSVSVPLSLTETLLIVAASGPVVTLLAWIVLGRWLSRQVERLRRVQAAAEKFAGSRIVSGEVGAALVAADGSANDEIARMAGGIDAMMRDVQRANEQLTVSRAELAALNATLEQRIDERTRELAAARDTALSAVRAKERFLANMSHEIRTPMNGMLGALDLLSRTRLDEHQHSLLTMSASSGEALLAILNDVLDYSKIEADKLELVPVAFAPFDVAAASVQLFRAAASKKALALQFESSGNAPARVLGDPVRLRQVLLNLIGNALKFTEHGQVTVRVTAAAPAEGRVLLTFEVRDTGVGIDPSLQQSIFEPFMQSGAGPQRKYGGTGLGLAISRRIVSAMGGELTVTSTPGAGSAFAFGVSFPIAEPSSAEPPSAPYSDRVTALAGRVLLVEDNPVNSEIAIQMLGLLGVTVEHCVNGQEAVDRLRDDRFDLVLMDNQMPVLDGLAATRLIRAHESSNAQPRTPIVSLTASALAGDAQRCLQAGMDAHLPKPFTLVQLHETLARWLKPRGG